MNLRKKIWHKYLYKFVLSFILLSLILFYISRDDPDYFQISFTSLFISIIRFFIEYAMKEKVPVYIKSDFKKQLTEILIENGATVVKTKGRSIIFRLPGNIWPLNRASVQEMDHYIVFKIPENLHLRYLNLITEKKIGLYDKI